MVEDKNSRDLGMGMWVFPKKIGVSRKMDGENNGKPY